MKKRIIIQEVEIDYENGFTCNYTMVGNDVTEIYFQYGFDIVYYIDDILNYRGDFNREPNFTEKELLSFSYFDKLYVVGRNYFIRDIRTKKFIPTFIHYRTNKENKLKCKQFINSLNQEYIKNISIEDATFKPYVEFDILLPEDQFNELLNRRTEGKLYWSDDLRYEAINLITIKSI